MMLASCPTGKKFLDKLSKEWYNVFTRLGKKVPMDPNFFETYIAKQTRNRQKLRRLGLGHLEQLVELLNKAVLPDTRVPVIAGGSVRDMFFGLPPNDYDIFMDLSPFTDDEKDDALLLTAMRLREALGLTEENAPLYAKHKGHYEAVLNAFMVYECMAPMYTFQLIGYNNPLLTTNPKQFVEESFDWSLTKALYDPLHGKPEFCEEFLETLQTGVIKPKDDSAYSRASTWLDWRLGKGQGLKIEYKHRKEKGHGTTMSINELFKF